MSGAGHARFEAAYRSTSDVLLRYFVRRVELAEDAADLVAEVFVRAWAGRERMPPADEARLWLFGIARHVLADHRRRALRSRGLADDLRAALNRAHAAAQGTGADADVGAVAVTAALATLGEDDRELIQLTAWEGLTPAQIAVVTGRSPGAVRVYLHRARGRLRRALEAAEAGPRSESPPRPVPAPTR